MDAFSARKASPALRPESRSQGAQLKTSLS
jgi:hypothetical protein